jgi:hypothetical protein
MAAAPAGTSLFFGALHNTWDRPIVAPITDAEASFTGCQRATRIQVGDKATLEGMGAGDNICVSTSGGRWAALKLVVQPGIVM